MHVSHEKQLQVALQQSEQKVPISKKNKKLSKILTWTGDEANHCWNNSDVTDAVRNLVELVVLMVSCNRCTISCGACSRSQRSINGILLSNICRTSSKSSSLFGKSLISGILSPLTVAACVRAIDTHWLLPLAFSWHGDDGITSGLGAWGDCVGDESHRSVWSSVVSMTATEAVTTRWKIAYRFKRLSVPVLFFFITLN